MNSPTNPAIRNRSPTHSVTARSRLLWLKNTEAICAAFRVSFPNQPVIDGEEDSAAATHTDEGVAKAQITFVAPELPTSTSSPLTSDANEAGVIFDPSQL
jgi:hypothetical protein